MEESGIKEQKLNLIDKFRKKWIIRKIQKAQKCDAYLKIKDSKIKYDREIMEIAWDFASESEIRKFTPVFQKEKANEDVNLLKYCDEQVQKEVFKEKSWVVPWCSELAQIDIGRKNPEKIKNCNEKVQRSIVMQDNKMLSYCDLKTQTQILEDKPTLILYCNEAIKRKILDKADPESLEWKTMIENSDLETLKSMTEGEKGKNIRIKWLNKSNQKMEDIISMMNYGYGDIQYLSKDKQQQFFEYRNLLERYELKGSGCNEYCLTRNCEKYFGKDCISDNFRQKYGQKKYAQYKLLIEDLYSEPPKYTDETKSRILNMFFREETLIQKIEPQKIKRCLEEEDNKKALFKEIIEEAYGNEALKILKEREGLDLENVVNTEIFLPQVLNNFREGFIQDLLSYDFEKIDDFIKIVKNPEDLKAFKFYYDRMSENLGENAVTMQMCMERYEEYSEILKEASEVNLNDEQMQKLEQLCSWRRNIAEITKIEELPQLEEKMQKALLEQEKNRKERGEENHVLVNKRIFGDDILLKDVENESAIYDLDNLTEEEKKKLTETEKEAMQLLRCRWIEIPIGMGELLKAINENIQIAPIFLNIYKAINKVKENDMEEFKGKVTDKEKIELAIRDEKYDVKKLIVDEIEVIDLGNMKTNFAIHKLFHPIGNSYIGMIEKMPQLKEYVSYDKKEGISTISARPKTEEMENEDNNGNYQYVYWDFSDNEVMGLHMGEGNLDAKVSHASRKIKPIVFNSGEVPLKRYSECKRGTEIAFYRRYRSHSRIEKEGHGGKVMPSAILGDPKNPVIIKIAQERFGKPIPILCKRGMLQDQKDIEAIKEAIKIANGEIEIPFYLNLQKIYEEEGIRLGEIQEEATLLRNTQQQEKDREKGEKE